MRARRYLSASVRDLGFTATLAQLPAMALAPLTLRRLKRRKFEESSRDGFDAAHGTDTAAVLVGRELGPVATRGGHLVIHYETTSEAAIRLPLDSLGADFSRFTFVDLGCGKGKPLLVASSYPFRRLAGGDRDDHQRGVQHERGDDEDGGDAEPARQPGPSPRGPRRPAQHAPRTATPTTGYRGVTRSILLGIAGCWKQRRRDAFP